MFKVLCIIIGYFIGCIQSAYCVGKLVGHIDIREHGSGNAGSTNVLRVLGVKAGALTFLGDILKSVVAVILCRLLFKTQDITSVTIYAGLGVVLGHDWPVFLKFKGGKGVASTIGLILALLNLPIIVISYAIGITTVVLTKYVSFGSILFSISLPILFLVFGYSMEAIFIAIIFMLLIIYKHIPNIKRLLNGTENKLGSKK
jgi:glycerol-3-phosphate acyltransferase PlsY